ncbi:hypothetical protein B0T14DRAFT_529358 [Immersiella caudata]|uniref:Mtf2-like C-terminal domain-containing protein n=1 Tax=Immersiella caudata TaxID=314043 RepID=A0AA39WA07_9PEZI|nr:hypothetical protein B0T14DRAFT_529358 [Immersiella caudata]
MSTTLLPFLYQTRTIQRLSQTRLSMPALHAFFHATSACSAERRKGDSRAGNAIPFEFPPGSEHLDPDLAIEQVPLGHRPTITPGERSTFNKIFEEIAKRGGRPGQPTVSASLVDAAIRPPGSGKPVADGDVEIAQNALGIIMKDAAAAQSGSWRPTMQPFSQKHLVGQISASPDPLRALMRYPPSLRAAARAALSALETERVQGGVAVEEAVEDATTSVAEDTAAEAETPKPKIIKVKPVSPLMSGIEQEQQRAAERARVEQKMQDAPTDFALWAVLEDEVFSMVSKLGFSDAPKEKKARIKKGAAAPEKALSMNIHGSLYPSYLLTALRLMDEKFSRSSPLALNILPRIKALGLSSYVLGVSTSFYNALAGIHWYRYGNAEAVFNLLEEMRHAGLFCDNRTFSLVQNISNVFLKAVDGESGPFLKEVVSQPEYEFNIGPRIEHWKKTIRAQIFEQQQQLKAEGK